MKKNKAFLYQSSKIRIQKISVSTEYQFLKDHVYFLDQYRIIENMILILILMLYKNNEIIN